MTGIQHLNTLALAEARIKNPSVPEHAIINPKFKDKTANDLQRAIIKWLQLNSHQAERITVVGRVLDTRSVITDALGRQKLIGSVTRIKSSMQKGSADISATIDGRSCKIEVKIGKDKQSDHQSEYQKQIEAAGGLYFVAADFQNFYDWYQGIRKGVPNE